MKTLFDARLVEEARRLHFRFACEDCAHFAPATERCSLGYQAAPRRSELDRAPSPAGAPPHLVELCKTYELA
jgi:hypothetical protein